MKIHVITDSAGQVIGTARAPEPGRDGPGGLRIDPGDGGRVHEVELPESLAAERDPEKLHAALSEHLRKAT